MNGNAQARADADACPENAAIHEIVILSDKSVKIVA